MKKFTKLAVLSAISIETVLTPLSTAFADTMFISDEITKKIAGMRKKMESQFPSHHSNIRSDSYSTHSILSKHHPYYSDGNHNRGHVHHQRREHHHHHVEHKVHRYVQEHRETRNNSGDTLAAGILGLAAAAILVNVFKKREQPQVVYQQIPKDQVIYEVQSTTTYQQLQKPWTHGWLQYCKKRYRSFNPQTGTFRGYDGLDHFCYAPVK
ncbi:hypothetical protein ABID39_000368 [Bartonella japonica]|uniref:Lectin-like protein BA14k n=1 Tax=Bartonella japonica TaxID=357761 RepID=A0ABV2FM81_9HYPH